MDYTAEPDRMTESPVASEAEDAERQDVPHEEGEGDENIRGFGGGMTDLRTTLLASGLVPPGILRRDTGGTHSRSSSGISGFYDHYSLTNTPVGAPVEPPFNPRDPPARSHTEPHTIRNALTTGQLPLLESSLLPALRPDARGSSPRRHLTRTLSSGSALPSPSQGWGGGLRVTIRASSAGGEISPPMHFGYDGQVSLDHWISLMELVREMHADAGRLQGTAETGERSRSDLRDEGQEPGE